MASTCLHNFRLILNDENRNEYVPPSFFDQDRNGSDNGAWRKEDCHLEQIPPRLDITSASAVLNRNALAEFFLTSGAVPWQHTAVNK